MSTTLAVDEGGESCLSPENLLISDLDSTEEVLRVQLRGEPTHGALWLGGLQLRSGQLLTLPDLRSLQVRCVVLVSCCPLTNTSASLNSHDCQSTNSHGAQRL